MDVLVIATLLVIVIAVYFKSNPLNHSKKFIMRRFVNWFPLGMSYAFLYMARYNLVVSKNALGDLMTKENFGLIFAAGTFVYGFSFLINGPLVDKIGGKKGIIIACAGACISNALMGVILYLFLHGQLNINLTIAFCILYSLNMYFQSYGAVSIIKVKAYWFHVRERGIFGAIFGTLISVGVYFAFDWGQAIADASLLSPKVNLNLVQRFIHSVFSISSGTTDALWLIFFIPSAILVFWVLIDLWLIKDTPGEANFEDFDVADASSGEDDRPLKISELLKRIFTNPIMITLGLVEFTAGVLRNGIMQWYPVFAKEIPQIGAEFFLQNWGLLLCLTGVLGGFAVGIISDNFFQSRRGPPAAIMGGFALTLAIIMALAIPTYPTIVGLCAIFIITGVIGITSITSGTAAADFGGKKATATASGIVDGCVYLGSGVQSAVIGFLATKDWRYWPVFLIPFAVAGTLLAIRIWKDIPAATKRYLLTVEKIQVDVVSVDSSGHAVSISESTVTITPHEES